MVAEVFSGMIQGIEGQIVQILVTGFLIFI